MTSVFVEFYLVVPYFKLLLAIGIETVYRCLGFDVGDWILATGAGSSRLISPWFSLVRLSTISLFDSPGILCREWPRLWFEDENDSIFARSTVVD
jgi:hypothetical protein